jgi:hypothetical protein
MVKKFRILAEDYRFSESLGYSVVRKPFLPDSVFKMPGFCLLPAVPHHCRFRGMTVFQLRYVREIPQWKNKEEH